MADVQVTSALPNLLGLLLSVWFQYAVAIGHYFQALLILAVAIPEKWPFSTTVGPVVFVEGSPFGLSGATCYVSTYGTNSPYFPHRLDRDRYVTPSLRKEQLSFR